MHMRDVGAADKAAIQESIRIYGNVLQFISLYRQGLAGRTWAWCQILGGKGSGKGVKSAFDPCSMEIKIFMEV
jgi:hypothetical protein